MLLLLLVSEWCLFVLFERGSPWLGVHYFARETIFRTLPKALRAGKQCLYSSKFAMTQDEWTRERLLLPNS